MSLDCASAGLTLNAVAISLTALVARRGVVGFAFSAAWVAGSIAFAVASSVEYFAHICLPRRRR